MRAVAIVADLGNVGIDIERDRASRGHRASYLTEREPAVTDKLLTRFFAIKEATYKAIAAMLDFKRRNQATTDPECR